MAKKEDNEPYRMSIDQLYETRKSRKILHVSLGSDIGLSGGIPMGCTVLIAGKPKSGKTTWTLANCADAQNRFKSKVFFFDIEGRLDVKVLNQIKGLKKDIDSFEIIRGPAIFDKDGKVIGIRKLSAEQWWTLIGEIIVNHPGSVIVVDSVSKLSSEKEMSEGMGYQGRGDLQKLEAQFCRQYADLVMPNGCVLFLLAQIQSNTSGYGEAWLPKCGNSIKHAADATIFVKNTEKWKEIDGKILGQTLLCRIDCSALGSPFVDTNINLRFGYGIDDLQDLSEFCINFSLIKTSGSWYTLPFIENNKKIEFIANTTKIDEKQLIKVQGIENIRQWLSDHTNEAKILDKQIRTMILGDVNENV